MMTGSNGASASWASAVAAPALPLAVTFSTFKSPPSCRARAAGFSPAAALSCVKPALPDNLNGCVAAIVALAVAWPNGVNAEASSSCHCVLSPDKVKWIFSNTVLPPALMRVTLSRRASAMPILNGEARLTGMLDGSSDGAVLATDRLATCSSLMAMPSEKNWNGDQLMSMLSAVMCCVLLR